MPFPTCASRLKHGLASVVATEESLLNERLAAAFQWHTDDVGYMQDLSGIYADGGLIAELGPALASLHGPGPTVVVAPGTQGWVLGPLVAASLGVGFVQIHKDTRGGDLAEGMYLRLTPPDYQHRSLALSVRRRHLCVNDRVLLVDDWVETGAQVTAVAALCSDAGAEYLGAAAIVSTAPSGTARKLLIRSLLTAHDLPVARQAKRRR